MYFKKAENRDYNNNILQDYKTGFSVFPIDFYDAKESRIVCLYVAFCVTACYIMNNQTL